MSVHLSALLPALAAHAGTDMAAVLAPLRDAFWLLRGRPEDFRSDIDAPSSAGSMKGLGRRIAFPEGLPYIAGVACGDNIRLTGAEIAPGALWYGDFTEAKLVLLRTSLPMTIVGGVAGRRIGEVVGHPALAALGDTIISAHENEGHTTFRLTASYVRIDDPLRRPTPRADWNAEIEEMERRQGLRAA